MWVIFTVWIVFIHVKQKTNLNLKKSLWNNDFCGVLMPSKDTKILEFNQYQNSDKTLSISCRSQIFNKKWMNVKIILKNHLHQK